MDFVISTIANQGFALHELILNEAGEPVDWRYLLVNAAFEKMSGHSRYELLGCTASEAAPELPLQELLACYGKVALTGEPVQDICHLESVGRYFSVSIYSPERLKFAILAIDVTEQIQTEMLLRRKEELLEQSYAELHALYEKVVAINEQLEQSRQTAEGIFHAVGDGLVVCDGETGAFLAVNRQMTELFGYTEEEFKREGIRLILSTANLANTLDMIRRTAQEGARSLFELGTQNREGKRAVIEIHLTPVTIGDEIRCLMLVRDVTERKQMEERMEFLRVRDPLTEVFNRSYFETDMLRSHICENRGMGLFMCDLDGLKLINDMLGHHQGDELLRNVAGILAAGVTPPDYVARIGDDKFAVVLKAPARERMDELHAYYCRMVAAYNEDNPYLPMSLAFGWALGNGDQGMEHLFKEADKNMYQQKIHQKSERRAIIHSMLKTLESRDNVAGSHADRMGDLMEMMGRKLRLPRREIADLRLFAKFHDIGKVGVPDSILKKPGPLTEEEMSVMRLHCEIGYRIAKVSPDMELFADLILRHQEHWDGGGYPLGISENSIPLPCRILGIVDAYDAMTNDRPYRKAMMPDEALAELRRCAGTQFDPDLVELFASQVESALQKRRCASLHSSISNGWEN